jgi:transcriptional regulator with XRE-family HTH domain
MATLKENVAANLTNLRKSKKLTQSELAERFSYSDKAVSKWEHGDALPSVDTLQQLADFYGVTIDYLTHEGTPETKRLYARTKSNRFNKGIITALAISLVWILAVCAALGSFMVNGFLYWMAFVWAVPCSLLIALIFNAIWGPRKFLTVIIIGFSWTLLAALYIELGRDLANYQGWRLWMLFLLGIPTTIGAILWSHLKVQTPSDNNQ